MAVNIDINHNKAVSSTKTQWNGEIYHGEFYGNVTLTYNDDRLNKQ